MAKCGLLKLMEQSKEKYKDIWLRQHPLSTTCWFVEVCLSLSDEEAAAKERNRLIMAECWLLFNYMLKI